MCEKKLEIRRVFFKFQKPLPSPTFLYPSSSYRAAFQVNKKIGSLKAEEARKNMEDWEKAPTFLSNPQRDPATLDLLTGSSSRFNVYGNDFGWGRSVAVRSRTQEGKVGKLTMFLGPEEGSIDFECCLWPETIRAMAEDAEFMQAMLSSQL